MLKGAEKDEARQVIAKNHQKVYYEQYKPRTIETFPNAPVDCCRDGRLGRQKLPVSVESLAYHLVVLNKDLFRRKRRFTTLS